MREGHCLVLDAERKRLVHLTGFGVRPVTINGFGVDLEAHDHPLVRALSGSRPVVLAPETVGLLFSRRTPVLALPLHGTDVQEEAPGGLLLVRPVTANLADLEWVSEYLGYRLVRARLRSTSVESERRLRRDRDLLRSILDRVTDPVILTDTEGRMVIANDRAERLFATREGESEGRRRAIAINNMLFSSALGRSAVEQMNSAPRELALVDPTEGSDLLFELISATAGDARMGMGIVSVLRNVSDLRTATQEIQDNYQRLRAAEAEVRAERDRLDLIIDSVADPILVTDSSGNVVMMNTPAERLFSASKRTMVEIQRVQANDANFTSFVSNLLFGKTGASKYQGGVNLVDPKSGRSIPMEAVSGNVVRRFGRGLRHRHHPARPDRSHRARAALRAAQDGLGPPGAAGTGGDVGARPPERAPPSPGDRARTGVRGEVAVPRERLPRRPNAPERDPRLHEPPPAGRHGPPGERPSASPWDGSMRTPGTC